MKIVFVTGGMCVVMKRKTKNADIVGISLRFNHNIAFLKNLEHPSKYDSEQLSSDRYALISCKY